MLIIYFVKFTSLLFISIHVLIATSLYHLSPVVAIDIPSPLSAAEVVDNLYSLSSVVEGVDNLSYPLSPFEVVDNLFLCHLWRLYVDNLSPLSPVEVVDNLSPLSAVEVVDNLFSLLFHIIVVSWTY